MKKIIKLFFIIIIVFHCNCEKKEIVKKNLLEVKQKILEDLKYPEQLLINENGIFINDSGKIFLYSLNKITLKKIFNNNGDESCGETKIFVNGDKILIYYYNTGDFKILSILGNTVKTGKISSFNTTNLLLLSNKIVRVATDFKGVNIILLDNNLREIKSVLKIIDKDDKKGSIETINVDFGKKIRKKKRKVYKGRIFVVCNDKRLYVADTTNDFSVKVFDGDGNYLKNIRKRKYKRIKCTEKLRKILSDINRKEYENKCEKQRELIDIVRRIYVDEYPEFMPPFSDIFVNNTNLFFKTFEFDESGKSVKFIVMDLDGKNIKICFLPTPCDFLYSFFKDKYYFLRKNKQKWSLVIKKWN